MKYLYYKLYYAYVVRRYYFCIRLIKWAGKKVFPYQYIYLDPFDGEMVNEIILTLEQRYDD